MICSHKLVPLRGADYSVTVATSVNIDVVFDHKSNKAEDEL